MRGDDKGPASAPAAPSSRPTPSAPRLDTPQAIIEAVRVAEDQSCHPGSRLLVADTPTRVTCQAPDG
jgi:hypothetical protein